MLRVWLSAVAIAYRVFAMHITCAGNNICTILSLLVIIRWLSCAFQHTHTHRAERTIRCNYCIIHQQRAFDEIFVQFPKWLFACVTHRMHSAICCRLACFRFRVFALVWIVFVVLQRHCAILLSPAVQALFAYLCESIISDNIRILATLLYTAVARQP